MMQRRPGSGWNILCRCAQSIVEHDLCAASQSKNVEAHQERRQCADNGEHRIASADACRMIEDRRADRFRELAQRARLGFGDDREMMLEILSAAGPLNRIGRGECLHQRLGRAAGFRYRDEPRRLQVKAGHRRLPAFRIGIVVKRNARSLAYDGFKGFQGLSAEARSAYSEHRDVGRVLAETVDDGARRIEVVGARGDAEQLKRPGAVLIAQP